MEKLKYRGFTYTFADQEDNDVTEIDIDGTIGRDYWEEMITGEPSENTGEAIRDKIRSLEAGKIIVNINSPGGDVNDGLMIFDVLAESDAQVETVVRGMTASAATIISQAASPGLRKMSKTALYLVHKSMVGLMGWYNVNELESLVADNKAIDGVIAELYARRSGGEAEEYSDLMAENNGAGIWLTADEAKERGLIDVVVDALEDEDDDEAQEDNAQAAAMDYEFKNGLPGNPFGNITFNRRQFSDDDLQKAAEKISANGCLPANQVREILNNELNYQELFTAEAPAHSTPKVETNGACTCNTSKPVDKVNESSKVEDREASARNARSRLIKIIKLKKPVAQ